jgi:DNA-binding LacI/PurR family transcriptional regulator
MSERRRAVPQSGRATVKTISERAGVATSTVSRALRGDPRISEETRERILGIAHSTGYTPNALAASLVTRRSGVVGLVVGRLENPFYAELIERLHRALAARGKRAMVLHVGGNALDSTTMRAVFEYQMDGCIIAAAPLDSTAAEICEKARLPMVMINRVARVHTSAVSCNNQAGGRLLGELLVRGGHRRIAFVAGRANTSTTEQRERGLAEALAEAGLERFAFARGAYTYDSGYRAAESLLASAPYPDAVFAANDIMACGVIDALRTNGAAVPDDISVVGFDDIRPARWAPYRLTTVAQPTDPMVDRALDLLEKRIADPSQPGEDIQIHGTLRIRQSARLPVGMTADTDLDPEQFALND